MKTTIEISDLLLAKVRKLAERDKTTLRALVESGLLKVIAERRQATGQFRLRRASFKGQGLQSELAGADFRTPGPNASTGGSPS
ncbi:MAG: type II toxin-antitoxin system VapB family antitoxin [Sterolibacteriaceae bacterium MAG5]|nr:type II toxin-antitoxin system VapB family antitoxin [Candidatus Nitricoxidireducens bremensis]